MNRNQAAQRIIEVKGRPFEQGCAQGSLARLLIVRNVATMKRVAGAGPYRNEKFKALLDANLDFLGRTEPALLQEMEGIALGAGVAFEDIALINIPLFFMFQWLPQECTMAYFGPPATADGRSYLMKNRDMGFDLEHVVLNRRYEDGSTIVEVNGAGIVTYPGNGLNSRGLALATTGVWSRKIPITLSRAGSCHVLVNSHLILENCATVDHAISYLAETPRMNGLNLILADKEKAVAVEMTRDKMTVSENTDGVLFRSNHYVSEEFAGLNQTAAEYPSTYKRYFRIGEYVKPRLGWLAFQDMLAISADHENGPVDCICRHGAENAPSKTIYSSVVVLEDGQVWTTLNNPCESMLRSAISI